MDGSNLWSSPFHISNSVHRTESSSTHAKEATAYICVRYTWRHSHTQEVTTKSHLVQRIWFLSFSELDYLYQRASSRACSPI
uniref:Uncharacterized protein n=1 Tax=Hyaloperonospora arabidopsidis (strain Emoy2) TaxID=559515 RepID=M4BQA4_HYAAE